MARGNYHHGNLRQELLDLAFVELEAEGLDALSFRKLAAKIGVASSAPYRHFASHDELVRTMIQTLAGNLQRGFQSFLNADGTPESQAQGAFRWYLEFAHTRPEFYRLVFSDQSRGRLDFESELSAEKSFGLFKSLIEGVSGIRDDAVLHKRSMAVWSLLHGYAMLRIDKTINSNGHVDQAEETVLDLALKLAAEPVQPSL